MVNLQVGNKRILCVLAHNSGTNCTTNDYTYKNHNVMKRKTFYEAPETELILVNYEEAFLNGTTGGYTEGGGGSYGDDDTNDNGEY